ncbi:TPA: hypothetical protein ACH3X2_009299 [Trebouxia sp. C0005]
MADVLEVDSSQAMQLKPVATQLVHPPFEDLQALYSQCLLAEKQLSLKDLRLTPLPDAEVKHTFLTFAEHMLDTDQEALPRERFGDVWNSFLEERHRELHGQALPMQGLPQTHKILLLHHLFLLRLLERH